MDYLIFDIVDNMYDGHKVVDVVENSSGVDSKSVLTVDSLVETICVEDEPSNDKNKLSSIDRVKLFRSPMDLRDRVNSMKKRRMVPEQVEAKTFTQKDYKNELMNIEIYYRRLKCLKLERELSLPPSSITADIAPDGNVNYTIQDYSEIQSVMENNGDPLSHVLENTGDEYTDDDGDDHDEMTFENITIKEE